MNPPPGRYWQDDGYLCEQAQFFRGSDAVPHSFEDFTVRAPKRPMENRENWSCLILKRSCKRLAMRGYAGMTLLCGCSMHHSTEMLMARRHNKMTRHTMAFAFFTQRRFKSPSMEPLVLLWKLADINIQRLQGTPHHKSPEGTIVSTCLTATRSPGTVRMFSCSPRSTSYFVLKFTHS
jgi:hypothetical protein